jgi:hypothetical protein
MLPLLAAMGECVARRPSDTGSHFRLFATRFDCRALDSSPKFVKAQETAGQKENVQDDGRKKLIHEPVEDEADIRCDRRHPESYIERIARLSASRRQMLCQIAHSHRAISSFSAPVSRYFCRRTAVLWNT